MHNTTRVFLAIAFVLLAPCRAVATCEDQASQERAKASVQANLQSVRASQKELEAEIERELESKTKTLGWNNEHRSKLFMTIIASPTFASFEREKQPYTSELRGIIGKLAQSDGKADPQETCTVGSRIADIVTKIKDVNARQYGYMLQQVKAAK
jgi:hypothetical protein